MILIPQVDLAQNPLVADVSARAVTDGAYDALDVARQLAALGFPRLQLGAVSPVPEAASDLYLDVARDLLRQLSVPLQVVVNATDERSAEDLLDAGAAYLVLHRSGRRAGDRIEELARDAPDQVIASVELSGGRHATASRGGDPPRDLFDLIAELEPHPLAGLLVQTSAFAERLGDGDLALLERIVDIAPWPVQLSGSASSVQDLRNVADRGVAGAVLLANQESDQTNRRLLAESFHPSVVD